MNVVESAILSTDLAMYFKKRDKFLELIDNGEFDWQSDEKKECKLIPLCVGCAMMILKSNTLVYSFRHYDTLSILIS